MNRERTMPTSSQTTGRTSGGTPYLAGAMLGLAIAAAWAVMQSGRSQQRRYADRAPERRAPMSLFIAGDHPRRRAIDRSGAHPLFERREEVYEAY
jgi:hypothetical protein